MQVLGQNLIGSQAVTCSGGTFRSYYPGERKDGPVEFHSATGADLERACELAEAAFEAYAATTRDERAIFLETIAANLEVEEGSIVPQAMAETGLPEARLKGELGRTTNQIRLFVKVLREGAYLDARVDRDAQTQVDLRLIQWPLGPVAVFGASNFPLAFSVAGGDTISALAAGCPVIAKAHPAHPATSEIVGRAIQRAVAACGLPEGVFSLLFEGGIEIGLALAADPRIQAIGFTGSRRAGLSLCQVAQQRPVPIPVYAEMSSINPVLLLSDALETRASEIGASFAAAQMLGAGQFCTNPGLLLAVDAPSLDRFVEGVRATYAESGAALMLTEGIHSAYREGLARLEQHPLVRELARGAEDDGLRSQPALFEVDAEAFLDDPGLEKEVFGAASLLVKCQNVDQLGRVVDRLEGQLTGAIHATDADLATAASLMKRLERRVGRVLFNGFGTGVAVSDAMVHGGLYPATSDARTTSVGSLAIARFLRPICYQNTPEALLPRDLQDANLKSIPHRSNGTAVLPQRSAAGRSLSLRT